MTIRVAVTGHRASVLEQADLDVLRARVDEVLEGIALSGPTGERVLVSGLAEGADRLVAVRALGAGYELAALLPFPSAEYEADFDSSESIEEFRTLLGEATAVDVVQPDDERSDDEHSDDEHPDDERSDDEHPDEPGRGGAYVRLGRQLAADAQVLIALWDGEPARGGGGTAEVVAAATERNVPVVWIDSSAPHEVRAFSSKHPPTTVPPPVQAGVRAVVSACLATPAADRRE